MSTVERLLMAFVGITVLIVILRRPGETNQVLGGLADANQKVFGTFLNA